LLYHNAVALVRRRIGRYVIAYDEASSRRLARFGHETSGPEHVVRRVLYGAGLHFRTLNRDLPGSPDAANRSKKWAVFVHGCYWHHHAACRRATVPVRNRAFWLAKFRENRRRDRRVVSRLEAAGFTVAVIWECDVANPRLLSTRLSKILRAMRRIAS
jgi:DNA mismatch endonuclease (patch repair protein)